VSNDGGNSDHGENGNGNSGGNGKSRGNNGHGGGGGNAVGNVEENEVGEGLTAPVVECSCG